VSESESKNVEQASEATKSVTSAVTETTNNSGNKAPQARGAAAKAPRSVSAGVAWLALLLVIVSAGAAAWLIREGQHREAALAQRVAGLETAAQQEQFNISEETDRWKQELQSGLGGLEKAVAEQTAALSQSLASAEAQLAQLDKELARFSASDRNSWLLAETGHLLRLANQRLVMAGDPVAAQALLSSADAILREIDDPNLHGVRGALAADVAALRAVPKVDVEGIYLRLAALIEQADQLVIFQFQEQAAAPNPVVAEDWQGRLRQGYQAALTKLADYIIIRRRDIPMQALMDPQWEGLVRLNLRMLLEQAQVALLSGNQTLYVASLERAQQWVAQFQDSDTAAARAISAEISQLSSLTIQVPQPNISRSQQALDEAIEQRVQSGGEQ
jgi:uroporphyrin-III C-methyltransferase